MFYRDYDLIQARKHRSSKQPVAHQQEALGALQRWFGKKHSPAGGILALPTGGGKTFTTARFLTTSVLAQANYKVLWLAHTHHLLEQAFYSFGPEDPQEAQETGYPLKDVGYEVGHITGNRDRLAIRVVSGGMGYFPVSEIKAADDVLICTLQTITKAHQNKHQKLEAFLQSIHQDRFFVVFDEAHHLPAPSYRKLICALRDRFPGMALLGLTATPTYHDESKRGWLYELFPQGVTYRADVDRLIADGVLAKPIFEQPQRTDFTPHFDEEKYRKWVNTYRDLPEEVITRLAQSEERNAFIAQIYAERRHRYGKTIMFADRWFQCEQLKTFLERYGVRAGTIYSHVDATPGTVEERNQRDQDENAKVLKKFRRNELDVLINIRMLTEGTDVPDAQTVFLTRQTTSNILLTQMIGRALRGPKFGGTENAYIVPFIDNWQQAINWATFDLQGGTEETTEPRSRQQALQLISIDRVIQLTRQQNEGIGVEKVPFLRLLPIGWYQASFEALTKDSEDAQVVHHLVLVFDNEQEAYEGFIEHLLTLRLDQYASESVTIDQHRSQFEDWQTRFFNLETHIGDDLLSHLFHLARHIAQHPGEAPPFFPFADRERHDLDALAQQWIHQKLDPVSIYQKLESEYQNPKRYWNSLYPDFQFFRFQYNACADRLIQALFNSPPSPPKNGAFTGETRRDPELPQHIKDRVKKRDGKRCVCCGTTRNLTIDHIKARYHEVSHQEDNLQTLCRSCNSRKNIQEINFLLSASPLLEPPLTFPEVRIPDSNNYQKRWEEVLRQSINFFYQCSAVEHIHVPAPSDEKQIWRITLRESINPNWLQPHLSTIEWKIRCRAGGSRFQKIVLAQPNITLIPLH